MRFRCFHLQNFRPFIDEELEFSTDPDRNVTVVHGQNGSGKTTLLKALRWTLFGKTDSTSDTASHANHGKMAELAQGERLEVQTILEFEHEGTEYKLTRTAVVEKQSAEDLHGQIVDQDVKLLEMENSEYSTISNPTTRIQQFLPKRLSSLFLFDGEYINELSGIDDRGEIKEAIQNVMGLEVLERSIGHLESVEHRFKKEMEQHGSDELRELSQKESDLEDKQEKIKHKIGTKEDKRAELKQDIADINQKLEQIEGAAELQKDREQIEEKKQEAKAEINRIKDDIQREISKKGYLTFAMGAVEDTAKNIDRLREEGKIPSELSNNFVEELLEDGECICERPLQQNTEPYQAVASYKDDATSDGLDRVALQLVTHIGQLQGTRNEFFEAVEELVKRRHEWNNKLEKYNQKLDEISEKIETETDYDPETDESPQELEQARNTKIEKRGELKEQINQHQSEIEKIEAKLKNLREEIEEAKNEKAEAQLARKRMIAARLVREDIEGSFEELQQQVRQWSNDRVQETFGSVATKSNYVAEISEDFELKIREDYDGAEVEVNKSRGERQIASLAFIGSLVSIAKERHESDTDTQYFSGGIYPIVMDSPFGSLDKQHRREISRIIPNLGEQVIVFATDGQWEGPVAEEMQDIAGKEWQLEYSPGDDDSFARTKIVHADKVPVEDD